MVGSVADMEEFTKIMGDRLNIRKAIIEENVSFNGCTTAQDLVRNNTTMIMER